MTKGLLLLAFLSSVTVLQKAPAHAKTAPSCTAKQFERFSKDNRPGNRISLDCSLTLPEGFRVTANLVFEGVKASDTVLDCNGGTIDVAQGKSRIDRTAIIVRSRQNADGTWDAPTGVTVRNCTIKGFVRLYGLDENANGANMKASSRNPDHTALAQAAAPKGTILDNLTIIAPRGIPLYIGPGVTRTMFENSRLKGRSSGTAIYLDAESARNTVRCNTFDITTGERELIAIDGSTRNTIVGNQFHDPVMGASSFTETVAKAASSATRHPISTSSPTTAPSIGKRRPGSLPSGSIPGRASRNTATIPAIASGAAKVRSIIQGRMSSA